MVRRSIDLAEHIQIPIPVNHDFITTFRSADTSLFCQLVVDVQLERTALATLLSRVPERVLWLTIDDTDLGRPLATRRVHPNCPRERLISVESPEE